MIAGTPPRSTVHRHRPLRWWWTARAPSRRAWRTAQTRSTTCGCKPRAAARPASTLLGTRRRARPGKAAARARAAKGSGRTARCSARMRAGGDGLRPSHRLVRLSIEFRLCFGCFRLFFGCFSAAGGGAACPLPTGCQSGEGQCPGGSGGGAVAARNHNAYGHTLYDGRETKKKREQVVSEDDEDADEGEYAEVRLYMRNE